MEIERRIFGGMNKNASPENLQEGEYTDAFNLRILLSPNGDGKPSKPLGTTVVSPTLGLGASNPTGFIIDHEKQQLYYFVDTGMGEITLICRYDLIALTHSIVFTLPFNTSLARGCAYNGDLFLAFGKNGSELAHIAFYDNMNNPITYSGTVVQEWYSRLKKPPLPCQFEFINPTLNYTSVIAQFNQRSYQFCASFVYYNGMESRYSYATELAVTGYQFFGFTTVRVGVPLPSDFSTNYASYANVIQYVKIAFRESYAAVWKICDIIDFPTGNGSSQTINGQTFYVWTDFENQGNYNPIATNYTDLGSDQVPLYANDSLFVEGRIQDACTIEDYNAPFNSLEGLFSINPYQRDIGGGDTYFPLAPYTKCLMPDCDYFISFVPYDYGQRKTTSMTAKNFKLSTISNNDPLQTTCFEVVPNVSGIPSWVENMGILISENQTYESFLMARLEMVYYVTGYDINSIANPNTNSDYQDGSPLISNTGLTDTPANNLTNILKDTFDYVDNPNTSDAAIELWLDISNFNKFDTRIPYVFNKGDYVSFLTSGGSSNCGNNIAPSILKNLPIKSQNGRFLVVDYPTNADYLCSCVLANGAINSSNDSVAIGGKNGKVLIATNVNSAGTTPIWAFYSINTDISDDVLAIGVFGIYCVFATAASKIYYFNISNVAVNNGNVTVTDCTPSDFGIANKIYSYNDGFGSQSGGEVDAPVIIGCGQNGLVFNITFSSVPVVTIVTSPTSGNVSGCSIGRDVSNLGVTNMYYYVVSENKIWYTTSMTSPSWTLLNTFSNSNVIYDVECMQWIQGLFPITAYGYVIVCGSNNGEGWASYTGAFTSGSFTDLNIYEYGTSQPATCVGAFKSISAYTTFITGQSGDDPNKRITCVDSDGNVFGANTQSVANLYNSPTASLNVINNTVVSCYHGYNKYADNNEYDGNFIIVGDRNSIIRPQWYDQSNPVNNSSAGIDSILNYGAKVLIYTPKGQNLSGGTAKGQNATTPSQAIYYESVLNSQNYSFAFNGSTTINNAKYRTPNNNPFMIGVQDDGDVFAIQKTFRGTRWKYVNDNIFSMTPRSDDILGQYDPLYPGWHKGINRPNISTPYLPSQKTYNTSIRFSEQIVQNSLVNNLNTYYPLNIKSFPLEYGDITRLMLTNDVEQEGSVLLAFHTRDTISIYVGRVQYNDIQGQSTVSVSDQILGSHRLLRGNYGCSDYWSVFRYQSLIFWWDRTNKRILKYDVDGIIPISDNGIREWVKQWDTANFMVDPDARELLCTFSNGSGQDTIAYCFSPPYGQPRWTTRYGFYPLMGVEINKILYALYPALSGSSYYLLHQHNNGSVNSFYQPPATYNKQSSSISFVFNKLVNTQKKYDSMWTESNLNWYIPTGGAIDAQGNVTEAPPSLWVQINNEWRIGTPMNAGTLSVRSASRFMGAPISSQYLQLTLQNDPVTPTQETDVNDSAYILAVNIGETTSMRTGR